MPVKRSFEHRPSGIAQNALPPIVATGAAAHRHLQPGSKRAQQLLGGRPVTPL
jgi:hypothetical protein